MSCVHANPGATTQEQCHSLLSSSSLLCTAKGQEYIWILGKPLFAKIHALDNEPRRSRLRDYKMLQGKWRTGLHKARSPHLHGSVSGSKFLAPFRLSSGFSPVLSRRCMGPTLARPTSPTPPPLPTPTTDLHVSVPLQSSLKRAGQAPLRKLRPRRVA